MSAGDRFKGWIESSFGEWKARIIAFILVALGPIGGVIWNLFSRQVKDADKRDLKAIADDPNTSPAIKALLDSGITSAEVGGEVMAWFLTLVGSIISILHLGGPQGRNLSYVEDRKIQSFRLDPLSVINLWRRFGSKYPWIFDDLRDQGWSEDHIDALKDATLFYPGPQDLVRWQAREVFEPEMIRKYGLDDEFGNIDLEPFRKAGMTDEQSLNYWRAHWEHTSWNQMVELLHRGLVTEAEVEEWFRLVEIVPYWRKKLIASAYNVPTRVDVRRFYDLKTIDETRLREIYSAQGYHGKDLDDYVLWTKIYVDLPDLLARWKNGWISLDEVKSRLVSDGMDPAAADELIETKVKADLPTDVKDALDLTKTEIYKGLKQGKLTVQQSVDLIMDLGYNEKTAKLLVDINYEAITGSPETYDDFKRLTDAYRKAQGLGDRTMPESVREAGDAVIQATKDLEVLKADLKKFEDSLVDVFPVPEAITKQLDEKKAAVADAEIQLNYAKGRYETELVKWRSSRQP